MNNSISKATVLFLLALITTQGAGQNLKLVNGFWFDGKQFEQKDTVYVNEGFFSNEVPPILDATLDLSGKYLIPPFVEAHTHNLSSSYGLDAILQAYYKEGTFYVQVLGCSHEARMDVLELLASSGSFLESSFSNGGITSSLGHPFMIYEPLAMGIYDPQTRKNRYQEIINSRLAQNDAYWFFDTVLDVEQYWDTLMKTRPDVIKIMLIDAENYQQQQKEATYIGRKGVSPKVAQHVVKKAHAAGLRVFAHIETANDFRLGLDIGVDVFAHMPGYGYGGTGDLGKYQLTPEDFKRAADQGIAIIPTAYLALRRLPRGNAAAKEKALSAILEFQRSFFEAAIQFEIPMALGADDFGETLMKEVDYLQDNKLITNLDLLNMMTENGAKICYPTRKIGRLKKGYEASFLALEHDPLKDFRAIKNIVLRIKQGRILE